MTTTKKDIFEAVGDKFGNHVVESMIHKDRSEWKQTIQKLNPGVTTVIEFRVDDVLGLTI